MLDIELPGYKLHSLERLNRKGGGVCAFVDSTFNVTPVQCQLFSTFECLVISIKINNGKILYV